MAYLYLAALAILLLVIFIFYKFITRNLDYWDKRNVSCPKPLPLVGNYLDIFTLRTTVAEFLGKLYNQYDTPYFGIFVFNQPYLVIREPELIKRVLLKDFNYFHDHNVASNEKCDPVSSRFLMLLKGTSWKSMRTKMTPFFSSGKLKAMLPLIAEAADEMVEYLEQQYENGCIEAREVCTKYSTDLIATCAFGIKAHCFKYENSEFMWIGRKIFAPSWKTAIRRTSYFMAPSLVKIFRLPFLEKCVANFMREAFWAALNERVKTQGTRNDLIDIINKLRENDETFDGDKVIAQAGQFFIAGYNTVGGTMSFALYEMCINPELQRKVREEINAVLSQYSGFTYEAINDLKYLEHVVYETLRKYPVLPFLDRICVKDYKIPDSNLVIEKGTPIYIPAYGLHYDPKYFTNPEHFDPDRFSRDFKEVTTNCTYVPFGQGPRSCIGERFALVETKLGLATIIAKFEVIRDVTTPVPIKLDRTSVGISSEGGLPMRLRKL